MGLSPIMTFTTYPLTGEANLGLREGDKSRLLPPGCESEAAKSLRMIGGVRGGVCPGLLDNARFGLPRPLLGNEWWPTGYEILTVSRLVIGKYKLIFKQHTVLL